MFSWTDNLSRLNTVVSLNYSSGNGLRVNDVSSDVGQNWELMAGGVIARLPVGLPDDQKLREGNGTIEDITKYPAGYLYGTRNVFDGCPQALAKYPIFGDKNHLYKQHNLVAEDKEMDYFSFRFNGRSGLFVLPKDNGDVGYLLGDVNLKVWFTRDETMVNQGIRTTINVFYIQDENGLIYKFAQRELTKTLKYNYCDAKFTAMQTQPDMEGGNTYFEAAFDNNDLVNPYVVNSWYLSEIKDPLTLRVVTFNYTTRNINTKSGTAIQHYKEKNYSVISYSTSITQTPVLSSISFPDGHQVALNYGAARVDLNGASVLESVDIKYQSRFISKFKLFTSYFILNRYGTPSSDYQKSCARLCLMGVQRYGVDLKSEEPPYLFDYYMGSGAADDYVPPPFSHLKDIWGFYNGDNSRDFNNNAIPLTKSIGQLNNDQLKGLCYLRNGSSDIALNAKPGYAKNGLLRKITYPAGGTITYEYAQNQAMLNSVVTNVGGVHVSRTLVTDRGYSNDCNNPIITNYSYTLAPDNTDPSLWGIEMPVNSMVMQSHYEAESRYFYYKPIFDFGCDYRYQYPGIMAREQAISLTSGQQILLVLSEVMNVVSGVMTIIDVVSLCIKATPAAWVTVAIDLILSIVNVIISCTTDRIEDVTNTVVYNTDLNGSNPLPAQFKRVVITEGAGTNGRTEMEFTSADDYPVWVPSNLSFSMKQRFATWAYGLPKKITIRNAAGDKVKETENIYDFIKRGGCAHCPNPMGIVLPSCKCLIKKTTSQRNVDWSNPDFYDAPGSYLTTSNQSITVDFYDMYTGRAELDDMYERVYKTSDPSQYLETHTSYQYNIFNYQINSMITTQSNGDTYSKNVTYSIDRSSGVFDILNSNNMVTLPVSTTSGVGNSTISKQETEFAVLGNGDIRPSRTLQWRAAAPWTWENVPDPVETQVFTYDVTGKLIGMKDEGNRVISNIYDYDDKYVVASVINAVPVVDKIAYSSFETSTLGGWLLSGTASYNTSGAVTGIRAFNLTASNNLSAALNTAKAYRLSFWANNSNVLVSNATQTISEPEINGFTYYEYTIAQGVANVTLSGTATIDELRLYPQSARMRTVTFDPLIGKTADCDENNRITYYEYDALGRLRFVKDEHRNVVKMYEQNTGTHSQSPCAVVYYNKAISEIYTKNDCGAGYVGSEVVYTIPANTYSSTISQAAADLLAEQELNTMAQDYANTNGNCLPIYYNALQSQNFTKQGCPIGTAGTSVTYTVPAGKYSSIIDQADADQQALDEINANGQAYANIPGNASCTTSTVPVWEGTGMTQCQIGGTGHLLKQVKDMNPNSATYNQTQWIDVGYDPVACPPSNCTSYKITVPNDLNDLENLWIVYTTCNASGSTQTLYSMMLQWDDSPNNATYTILCLESPPAFRFGPSGPIQFVPEITVTSMGSCTN